MQCGIFISFYFYKNIKYVVTGILMTERGNQRHLVDTLAFYNLMLSCAP